MNKSKSEPDTELWIIHKHSFLYNMNLKKTEDASEDAEKSSRKNIR